MVKPGHDRTRQENEEGAPAGERHQVRVSGAVDLNFWMPVSEAARVACVSVKTIQRRVRDDVLRSLQVQCKPGIGSYVWRADVARVFSRKAS